MELAAFVERFDAATEAALRWLGDHGGFIFGWLRAALEGLHGSILWVLMIAPFYVVAIAFAVLGWRAVGVLFGLAAGLSLTLCAFMGLWPQTMATLALVVAATALALLVGLPLGVAAGFLPRIDRVMGPVLDLIQTLPPYIYLLPAIALLGYGPATALVATVIVAMPPAIRLTSLGIRLTPPEFIELGHAVGISRWRMFMQIRLPFAAPSIMAGVNQSLMMAFGMVVIAGIVGSGGLGETIYGAVRTLDIAKSIDAAVAIVILTMLLDRISQRASSAGRRDDG